MTHNWVIRNWIPVLFLKLDFEKAFDRVEHAYLWAILEKVGLGGTFTRLVKGLLSRAVSKVHINGRFTEEIPVTQGVRQGYPLSPLIFALSTQPLMDYLQHQLTTREIEGVKILEDLTICHRLFVDDVGIFIPANEHSFKKLQEAPRVYELASGAKLNLAKSVLVPLAMPLIPQWLRNTGCTSSKPGEIQKYSWASFGNQIKPREMYKFCLDRISNRILGWANRLLTFTGKVLLIQHVLQSITTYHMMYSSAPATLIEQINRLFKDFL